MLIYERGRNETHASDKYHHQQRDMLLLQDTARRFGNICWFVVVNIVVDIVAGIVVDIVVVAAVIAFVGCC